MSKSAPKPKAATGRPAKPPADRKSAFLRFRTREGLAVKLEAAAQLSGRAVSEEVERRLEKSFDDARIHEAIADYISKDARAEAVSVVSKLLGGDENVLAVHRFAAQYAVLAARMRAEKWEGDAARATFGEQCAEAARAIGTEAFEMRATLDWARANDLALADDLDPAQRVGALLADWHEETDARSIVEKSERRARTKQSRE